MPMSEITRRDRINRGRVYRRYGIGVLRVWLDRDGYEESTAILDARIALLIGSCSRLYLREAVLNAVAHAGLFRLL